MTTSRIHHLQSFLAVAELRSFTRAASALGVSPSALSQSVRALEEDLGAPLLMRTTRSVSVTDAGRRLVEQTASAMRSVQDALTHAVGAEGGLRGTLRLTVPRIACQGLIPDLVARFHRHHPEARVAVSVDDRLVDVVQAGFDAGVRLEESVERDMVTVRMTAPFRFVVVGTPAYLRRHGEPQHPRQLGQHVCIDFLSPTHGLPVPWDLERGGRVHKVPAGGRVQANDGVLLRELALRGVGLAYVSERDVAEHVRKGTLRVVLEAWATEVPGWFLYFPSRAQASPVLRAFVEEVRDALKDDPPARV